MTFETILKDQIGYDHQPKKIEVMTFGKDADEPGMWLQLVEGCGYDVWTLTAEQARSVAQHLLQAADEAEKNFKNKKTA